MADVTENVIGVFLDALRQVFTETGIEISWFGDADGKGAVQVITNIGITGDLRGCLLLETDQESAERIFRTMLGDLASKTGPEGLAEFRKASLCEITNQVAGRAITLLSAQGIECDITPPTIITADAVTAQIPWSGGNARKATRGPFGELVLTLGLEEQVPHR
jgi:CheY-specific phosphatase CheX